MPTSLKVTGTTVAELLADRETLVGSPREVFVRVLREQFNYDKERQPGGGWRWAAAAVAAGLAGLGAELGNRGGLPWWSWAGWLGCSLAGVVLAWKFEQGRRDERKVEIKLQWQIYCLLIRPIILEERPGLLDRNLPAARVSVRRPRLTPLASIRMVTRDGPGEMWRAALVGLWVGMVTLVLLRLDGRGAQWLMLVPLLGGFLGPVVWSVGRWAVYKAVADDPRLGETEEG